VKGGEDRGEDERGGSSSFAIERKRKSAPLSVGAPIWTKFGSLMQNNVQISAKWLKSKPEVHFEYGGGGHLFFKKEVVISQPSIEVCRQNLVC